MLLNEEFLRIYEELSDINNDLEEKFDMPGAEAVYGEEATTIEDVYEPYLLQCGFLKRTPRGRVVTEKGYRQVNMTYQNSLFDLESSD